MMSVIQSFDYRQEFRKETVEIIEKIYGIYESEHPNLVHSPDEIEDALVISSFLHAGQKRNNNGVKSPYIEHSMRVAYNTFLLLGRDELLIPALLHDTIEDCQENFAKYKVVQKKTQYSSIDEFIEDRFGNRTLSITQSLTNPNFLQDIHGREQKNQAYREHVIEEINKDPSVLVVKICDFLDNAGNLERLYLGGSTRMAKGLSSKYYPLVIEYSKSLDKFREKLGEKTFHIAQREIETVRQSLERVLNY